MKVDQRVAIIIPARDEERTVGPIVAEIVEHLMERQRLADQLIVVSDGSIDATAEVARDAGAHVITTAAHGKGQALRRAIQSSDADVLVFLDADVENFTHRYVTALLEPLLSDERLVMVKASYRRSLHGRPDEGGRVTESWPARSWNDSGLSWPRFPSRSPVSALFVGRRWTASPWLTAMPSRWGC